MTFIILTFIINLESGFSSVGRAFDCRGNMEIKGSLVQIREAGFFFPINIIIIPNKEIIIIEITFFELYNNHINQSNNT